MKKARVGSVLRAGIISSAVVAGCLFTGQTAYADEAGALASGSRRLTAGGGTAILTGAILQGTGSL